jgi:predicted amidohydrolase
MIVDPWGVVVAGLGEADDGEPHLATAEIDRRLLAKVRREMPLLRRT